MSTVQTGAGQTGAGPAGHRDAAETRRALLDAAVELFTTEGYDRTTVRAIADRAGVNQALLFRYFGNKEALFAEVIAGQALDVLHGGPPEELLDRALRSILRREDGDVGGLFDSALRSAGSSETVAALRDELGSAYGAAFVALADGTTADAALRAELLLGWLLGINLLRNVFRSEAVRSADPDDVVAHVSRAADVLLHGGRDPG